MTHLHLRDVDAQQASSPWGEAADFMTAAGIPVPRILKLFDYKPQWTRHLAQFTQSCVDRRRSRNAILIGANTTSDPLLLGGSAYVFRRQAAA